MPDFLAEAGAFFLADLAGVDFFFIGKLVKRDW
jgi:hypothetical protein